MGISEIEKRLMEFAEITDLEIKPNGTSTHGNCCTCQKCHHHHDDCVCEHNEAVRFIINLMSDIKSLPYMSDKQVQTSIQGKGL